ncbi:hypothetical protein [Nocardia sp. NPDC055049]
MPTPGDLLVWYIPQLGGPKFEHPVPDLMAAHYVLEALGKCANFEAENRIRGDYVDAGGVNRFVDWGDGDRGWHSVDEREVAAAVTARRARVERCSHAELVPVWERAVCVECLDDRGLWNYDAEERDRD